MRNSIIYLFFLLCASCSNDKFRHSEIVKQGNEDLQNYLERVPAYASINIVKDSAILFWFSKGTIDYDTSWTLVVNEFDNRIQGRYTQLLPSTVTGFDNYIDESSKLLYYDGFSFEMDKQKWDSIIGLTRFDSYISKDSILYTGCLHCPRYTAFYKSKLIINSKGDKDYLSALDSILRYTVINEFFVKKSKTRIQYQKSK
jgi:hypothetical protein